MSSVFLAGGVAGSNVEDYGYNDSVEFAESILETDMAQRIPLLIISRALREWRFTALSTQFPLFDEAGRISTASIRLQQGEWSGPFKGYEMDVLDRRDADLMLWGTWCSF